MSSVTINGDTSGSILLQAPAVSGSTTITMTANSGTLCVGGPAFRAKITSNQTIPYATDTKLNFGNEIFDTNSCYDTSLYRFTPNVAGYYMISSTISIQGTAGRNYDEIPQIWRNGSAYQNYENSYIMGTGATTAYTTNVLVSMNGTTDYIEMYIANYDYSSSSTVTALTASQFYGYWVRGL